MACGIPARATGCALALICAITAFACTFSSSGTSSEAVKILVLMKPGQIAFTRMPYCARSVAATVKDFGGLHAAFNNAGIFLEQQPLHEISLETYHRVMAVNAQGVFLAMQAEIRHMLAHGGGAIVNTSSGAGVIGIKNNAAYTAAKHGVIGLTR